MTQHEPARSSKHQDLHEHLTRFALIDGVYVVTIDQLGLVAEGETMDKIQDDLLHQIRDYINDWYEHLSDQEPHKHNKQTVQQLQQADRDGTLPHALYGEHTLDRQQTRRRTTGH